jgi:predicted phage baseplate assembly protein
VSDDLNPCGCCETPDLTPTVFNRPGLPALSYRVATQQTALARMLAALTEESQGTGLQLLTTRDLDDPAIAMLDAFAIVADVLSFYDERIANEGYLGTATERLSVLQLARAVGYELTPGVAASTYLSFSADSRSVSAAAATPASAAAVDVPAGTPVQSIPAQGQKPQTFETSADLQAVAEFNELPLLLTIPGTLDPGATELVLQGTTTRLAPGDVLLLASADSGGNISGEPTVVRVTSVAEDATSQLTTVEVMAYSRPPTSVAETFKPKLMSEQRAAFTSSTFGETELNSGNVASTFGGGSFSGAKVAGILEQNQWGSGWVDIFLGSQLNAPPTLPAEAGVFALRQHAAVFGANAPAYNSNLDPPWKNNWDDPATPVTILTDSSGTPRGSGGDEIVYLDNSYQGIVPGSWVTFIDPAAGVRSVVVDSVDALSVADYAISGKTTALHLADPPAWDQAPTEPLSDFTPRATAVYAQSERLTLAPQPNPNAITATTIMLVPATSTTALQGQPIVISGVRADEPGITVSEVATVAEATLDIGAGATILTLAQPLQYSYIASTVTINGNVVAATHGQTVASEVVGSSDGSANQSFTLNKPPLTYTAAAVAGGAQSTLALGVSGVDWSQVPTLYQLGPLDRGYVVRLDDDGTTHIIFGDGVHGARPPAGTENIIATYRSGIGSPGLLAAGQLTLLPVRPLGIVSVVNQLATGDAADPETLADARADAPLTTLTLDRIVSASDYENFTAAFAGVGKAQATTLWAGQRQLVQLTVAGVAGAAFEGEALLTTAIGAAQDPGQLFAIDPYRKVLFTVSGDVLLDPSYSPAEASAALAAAEAAIAAAFSFQARAFAQPVTANEVVQVVMSVAGVIDTHVTGLQRVEDTEPSVALTASPATWNVPGDPSSGTVGAELLVLQTGGAQIVQRTNG